MKGLCAIRVLVLELETPALLQPLAGSQSFNADGMADSVPVMTSVVIILQQIDTGVLPQCLYETPYMHDILARYPCTTANMR